MTKMIQLVEEMAAKISQITDTEQELVQALGDALSRVDQKLLQDVRKTTTEHETRRDGILHELQGLATRIGAFPAPRKPTATVEYAEPAASPRANTHGIPAANGIPPVNKTPPDNAIATAYGNVRPFSRGDWRQATSNIEDELDSFFKVRAAASH